MDRKKNAAFPAIRGPVNLPLTVKMALFRHFLELSASFLCQAILFHFREKTRLKAWAYGFRNSLPDANPRRAQERKEALRTRLGSCARDGFVLLIGGMEREAQASARHRGEYVCRAICGKCDRTARRGLGIHPVRAEARLGRADVRWLAQTRGAWGIRA